MAGFPLLHVATPAPRARAQEPRRVHCAHGLVLGGRDSRPPRARLLRGRARGGAALIVMEPLPVLPSGGVTPQNYRWRDDPFVPGLRAVATPSTSTARSSSRSSTTSGRTPTRRRRWRASGASPPGVRRTRAGIAARDRRGRRRCARPRARRGRGGRTRSGSRRRRVHVRVRHAGRRLHVGGAEPTQRRLRRLLREPDATRPRNPGRAPRRDRPRAAARRHRDGVDARLRRGRGASRTSAATSTTSGSATATTTISSC